MNTNKNMEELVARFSSDSWYYVRYSSGQAYYMVSTEEFNKTTDFKYVPIWHMLSGVVYTNTQKRNLVLVSFYDMPLNYQLDAVALNPLLRKVYEGKFPHIQKDQQMTKEWEKFYSNVDSALGTLKSEFAKRPAPSQVGYVTGTVIDYSSLGDPGDSMGQSESKVKTTKENNTMSLLSKIPGLNLSFGTLEKGLVALDFQGNLAFKDKASGGYVSLQKNPDGSKVQVHTGDLKFDVPFYTIPTKDLEVDDLVVIDGQLLVVEKKQKGGFKFVNPVTGNASSTIERNNILNMFFYTKVVSLFNLAGGEIQGIGLGNLDPMTLMILSGEGGFGGSGNIGELLVMSQLFGGQGTGTLNPMMLMLLANKGESGMDSMLPLLLISQNGGGLFGAKPTKKAAPNGDYIDPILEDHPKKAAKKAAKPAAKRKYTRRG